MMAFILGKTVLITGSTDGIGKETARQLLAKGAKVVIHGRDRAKTEETLKELAQSTGNRPEMLVADLASMPQVEQMAWETRQRYPELSVLINNAGLFSPKRILTEEGHELTFAVNYLSAFLLTSRLLNTLKSNTGSRIIFVSSALHRGADLNFSDLAGENRYTGQSAYGTSKLALVMYSRELSDRIRESGTTVNSLHPGGVNTKLLRAGFGGAGGLPPAVGAEVPVWLASAPDPEQVTGRYFDRTGEVQADPRVEDAGLRRQLWDCTAELLQPTEAFAA